MKNYLTLKKMLSQQLFVCYNGLTILYCLYESEFIQKKKNSKYTFGAIAKCYLISLEIVLLNECMCV